jgi:hypothetical protein
MGRFVLLSVWPIVHLIVLLCLCMCVHFVLLLTFVGDVYAALAAAQTAYDDAVQVANFAHRKYALGYLRLTHGYHTTKSVRKQNLALTLRTHCQQQAEFRRVCADLWVQLVSTLSNEELISAAPVWDVEWLEVCMYVCVCVCVFVY